MSNLESATASPVPSQSMDAGLITVTPNDKGVNEPAENDVLCGRGGSINSHPGNERFRTLVEKRKRVYLTARFKREKRLIASSIVSEIRDLNGKFLSRDTKSGLWVDIGDEKARDKTSQALRENAPSIRAEIEEEINEQRAEMYKEDPAVKPSYPAAPGGYYNSWYPSYYGYPQSGPPPGHHPPPGSHSHHHPHPPPPPHGYPHGHPHPPPPPHNSAYPPPPPPSQYDYYGGAAPPPHPPVTYSSKSTIEQTADFVSSGAESIKNWTKSSLSFGAIGSAASGDANSTVVSKPISYKHEDRRKMVKFRNDGMPKRRVRPCYSPVQSNHSCNGSILDQDEDMEPQAVDVDTNASIMSQVANHILAIGSFDAGGIMCGYENQQQPQKFPEPTGTTGYTQDTDMTVEWEGQEVQLVDEKKKSDESRMPPPAPPRENYGNRDHSTVGSVAFSSIGSCHSWLPEQVGAAASYFSGRDNQENHQGGGGGGMEYSTEGFSLGESVGGGSLTRVFENEPMASPNMSQRSLNQIPSWERSLRSKSPLSIGSHDDDDESLISKASSKQGAISPIQSMTDEMAWTRE